MNTVTARKTPKYTYVIVCAVIALFVVTNTAFAADTRNEPTVTTLSDGSKVIDTGGASIPLATLSTGVLGVTSCLPPGPRTFFHPGRDGLPCAATGLTSGLFVTGICQAGSCRATGFTSASGALSNFLNGVANSALKGAAQQLIGGMFGGSGSYYNSYGDTATGTTTLGDINFNDLTTSTDITGFDWNFDTTNTTNTTDLQYATTTANPAPAVTVTSPYAQPPTITQQLYTTDAQATGGVSQIPGNDQFQQDLVGITFNTDAATKGTQTLSLADLERAAQEARLREAMNSERQANTDTLRDYRGSNIGNNNMVTDPNTVDTPVQKPWWVTVVEFVGSLFGVSN